MPNRKQRKATEKQIDSLLKGFIKSNPKLLDIYDRDTIRDTIITEELRKAFARLGVE